MDLFLNIAGPLAVVAGLVVILFGRARAIEGALAVLAAFGVLIFSLALSSPYSPTADAGLGFAFGLLLIGGAALLMQRVIAPAE